MAFDPDEYLGKSKPSDATAFDPDAFLEKPRLRDSAFQMPVRRQEPAPVVRKNSGAANAALGVISGASDIGATLMTPVDWMARNADRLPRQIRNSLIANHPVLSSLAMLADRYGLIGREDRRGDLEAIQQEVADTDSGAYRLARVGTNVAGTLGVPGGIAKSLGSVPAIARSMPTLLPAIEASGMATQRGLPFLEQMGARIAGGGIAGGASAALVDPSTAETGVAMGAALPIGMEGLGSLLRGTGYLGRTALGGMTGTSEDAIGTAYSAGRQGQREFLDNVNSRVPMRSVVDSLRENIGEMVRRRNASYQSDMAALSGDRQILDMADMQRALDSVRDTGYYKGVPINEPAADVLQQLQGQLDQWSLLDPAEYHTPAGMDALKKSIGHIKNAQPFGMPSRHAADQVYNAVRRQIANDAPVYDGIMSRYSDASDTLDEITGALSGKSNSPIDASLRKLQSVMRNNAQTNYGNRLELVRQAGEEGGIDLMPALAGQALNSWMPRGMTGAIEKGVSIPAATAAAVTMQNPLLLAPIPFTSPRLMGNLLYGAGATARGVSRGASEVSRAARAAADYLGIGIPADIVQASRLPSALAFMRDKEDMKGRSPLKREPKE